MIPNAAVDVTNVATGLTSSTRTNDGGSFAVPFLIPGVYRLTSTIRGFKRFERGNLELRVGDRLEVDISLEAGAMNESVTVTAESPALDTGSASMGQEIDARRVAELPLANGNPFLLASLSGMSFTGTYNQDRPYDSYSLAYAMDGSRVFTSEIMVDGVTTGSTNFDNNQAKRGIINSFNPPADAVAEMKIQTALYDASVGQTLGGATNVSLKSGTKDFHGTAYTTYMNPSMTSNLYFSNAANIPRADFYYNRWGTTAGGPVYIPKVYNGRDRTFFFYGYEGIHESRPRGTTITVPTTQERAGGFSALLSAGNNYQIYDPATRRAIGAGRFQEDPFPGNIIPSNRISPIAQKILGFYSLPTIAGTRDGTNNLPEPDLAENVIYYVHTARVDHSFSDRHRMFSSFRKYRRVSDLNEYFHNLTTGQFFQYLYTGAQFDDVYTFSPSFVLNLRYGYNRFIRTYDAPPDSRGFDLTSLGWPASWNNSIPASIRRFPYITIAGYQSTYNGTLWRPDDSHTFAGTFNKVAGTHSLKFGTEYRIYRQNQFNYDNVSTGELDFGTTWTSGPLDSSAASPIGQGLASLLLGLPTGGFNAARASYAEQSTVLGLFVQDDWKATRNLTMNLGLRYEIEGPLTERYNRSVRGFDSAAVLPIQAQVQANYAANPIPGLAAVNAIGGLTFAGVGGQPRQLYDRDPHNFMPRIGLAYSLRNHTVLRAGYGIFFGFLGTRRTDVIQNGFTSNQNLTPSLDGGLSFVATLANPFPNGIQAPTGASLGTMTFVGQAVSFFNPKPLTPYMQRWEFDIQHELPHRVLIDVAYVGNRGTHLEVTRNLDALPNQYLSTTGSRDNATISSLSANVANPFYGLLPTSAPLATAVTNRAQLLLPYPQFTSISSTNNQGYSWYHSLQVKVEKRLSSGFTVQGAWTWSKFMEATAYLNPADSTPAKVISDQDYPMRMSISAIYELPFGRGRRFLSNTSRTVNAIIGGWQVNGVEVGQSGQALGFGNMFFSGNLHDIVLPVGQRTPQRWFNTDAGFVRNSALQPLYNYINYSVRFTGIRSDGINNFDLSAIKNIPIHGDRLRLQIRCEALNAFNHVMFSNPNTTPSSSAFGTVTTEKDIPRRVQVGIKILW
jgi:hypothetical protein